MSEREGARTRVMRNNQAKLDELEYFIETIAAHVFGAAFEDFRKLSAFLPAGANLSLLIDAARQQEGRDVAADFQFVVADLERQAREAGGEPPPPPTDGLFNFLPYLDLVAQPGTLLERVETVHREPLARLLEGDPARVELGLARVHAFAWLELVGLPDLGIEFDPAREKRLALDPPEEATARGLAALLARGDVAAEEGPLRRYLERARYLLSLTYRDQIRRAVAVLP